MHKIPHTRNISIIIYYLKIDKTLLKLKRPYKYPTSIIDIENITLYRTEDCSENDIRILDEEIEKCKKQKKGWIAATVIGAAGTVATGVAAGVQGAKLKEAKETKEFKQGEYAGISKKLEETTADKTKLEKEIKEYKTKTEALIKKEAS